MEELEKILQEHARRYPKMHPTDAVKLPYQNEFGGGHLIRDQQACLTYLRRECETAEEEDLEQLGKDFIRFAAEHKGSLDLFLHKLAVQKH